MNGHDIAMICLYAICAVIWTIVIVLTIIDVRIEKHKNKTIQNIIDEKLSKIEKQQSNIIEQIVCLEFMQKYKSKWRVKEYTDYRIAGKRGVTIQYVKDGKIKDIWLDSANDDTTVKRIDEQICFFNVENKCIKKFEFDIARERIISIREVKKCEEKANWEDNKNK